MGATRRVLLGWWIGSVLATGCAATRAPGAGEIGPALERVYPALVRVFVVTQDPASGRLERVRASGSGVIISPQGHVVTNHHVARNATRITVTLASREEVDAELVGTDPLADIAVLKLNLAARQDPTAPVPFAQWGDSDELRVGDVVLAMGSPGALSQSVTRGIVSNTQLILPPGAARFQLDGEDVGSLVRWIAHDAEIFGGNSGGPLVDLRGRIVGINEVNVASLGGAIPSNLARRVAEELIARGDVERSWTGLSLQPRLQGDVRTTGVLVAGIYADSPASRAGLRPGDMLLSFDGRPVSARVAEDLPPLNQLVTDTPVGREVEVVFEREGRVQSATLLTTLRQRPQALPVELKGWGLIVRDITDLVRRQRRLESARGVTVDSVRPGGPNAESRLPLREGDVLLRVGGREIENSAALRQLTEELTSGKTQRVPVLVEFLRDGRDMVSIIRIGREEAADRPARVRRAWAAMATQVVTPELAEALGVRGTKGVRVTEVYSGQAAQKAGVQVGDLITAVDGIAVEASGPEDADVFDALIRRFAIGSEVELRILRAGDKGGALAGTSLTLKMILETAPNRIENAARYTDPDFEFAARELVFDDRNRLKLPESEAGVFIERVEPAGWAALGGLAGGDVLLSIDGKPTSGIDELRQALDEARRTKPRRLVFFARRGILTFFRQIEPDWR